MNFRVEVNEATRSLVERRGADVACHAAQVWIANPLREKGPVVHLTLRQETAAGYDNRGSVPLVIDRAAAGPEHTDDVMNSGRACGPADRASGIRGGNGIGVELALLVEQRHFRNIF